MYNDFSGDCSPDQEDAMTSRERFLAACRCQSTDRPPVWLMRQAGRYLPEYRELRARHDFQTLMHTPELAAEVTLQPLRRFPLDAAIVFSDILTVPEALGLSLNYPEGGPVLSPRTENMAAIHKLDPAPIRSRLSYLGETMARLREALGEEKALLGFAGAPYTLATYMVEGGTAKHFRRIKTLAFTQPETLEKLLDILADAVLESLKLQIENGADAVQLFDTWAGELAPGDFRRFCLPYLQRIVRGLKPLRTPVIVYMNGVAPHFDELAAELDADVLGIDWRFPLARARVQRPKGLSLQGNLDPLELFGDPERIRRRAREIHEEMAGEPGHIMNLGHGILPETPIAGVAAFVEETLRLGDKE